ncbi:hypothetical protein Nepgr_001371 [Nepenthes gracilis]|uniref:Uncharacterized protein n=1 Tax=Nepenthes gracilis TaxID=150966 RepID=A0AAD3P544_NEPGR|nr:hypothetical protein Nepgr_001371 [Nepenthes gracilis]
MRVRRCLKKGCVQCLSRRQTVRRTSVSASARSTTTPTKPTGSATAQIVCASVCVLISLALRPPSDLILQSPDALLLISFLSSLNLSRNFVSKFSFFDEQLKIRVLMCAVSPPSLSR